MHDKSHLYNETTLEGTCMRAQTYVLNPMNCQLIRTHCIIVWKLSETKELKSSQTELQSF